MNKKTNKQIKNIERKKQINKLKVLTLKFIFILKQYQDYLEMSRH